MKVLNSSRPMVLVASLILALPTVVFAQDQSQDDKQSDDAALLEVIIVTGSRIARSGYETPSPVTMISSKDMYDAAPANLAEFVQSLPSVISSSSPATTNLSISSGAASVNSINLRGLGSTRTLVLLDGRRSAPSLIDGTVDINTFPQGLVNRVEIVTGGASAAYGSDAISGVVNYILDTEYEGIKATIEGGETTYGDDGSLRGVFTAGFSFASDRGRVLFNAEVTDREGIYGVPRDWNNNGNYIMFNPEYADANGQPQLLFVEGAGLSQATPGGIITRGPLEGTAFGIGGAPYPFVYGDLRRNPWMVGGDWQDVQVNNRQSLHASEDRESFFGRLSYELVPNIETFVEISRNTHEALGWVGVQFNLNNVTINADNAFLPTSVRDELAALGETSFVMGTSNADLPLRKTDNEREVTRYVVGANGIFEFGGETYDWDFYYQHGQTKTTEMARDITNNTRFAAAQDAVFDVGGNIVCRSVSTNPDCVPYNRFGINVGNSQAAYDYIIGNQFRNQTFTQDVAAVNLSGAPLENWQGKIAIATGLEWRREKVSGFVPEEFQSGWFVGNYKPNFGEYDVFEGYLEALMPIADGLDLNGAVRVTDYSISGTVTTWKLGMTYAPIEDVLLRITRSRDIRAPNLSELFTSGRSRTNQLSDPFNNGANRTFLEVTTGNLNLTPEIGDTWGLGLVYQPSWATGLSMSLDYFDIEITDSIGNVNAQIIIDNCFQGVNAFCAAIQEPTTPSELLQINLQPFNFAERRSRGVDIESSYLLSLETFSSKLAGNVSFRALGTRYLENYFDNGISTPTDTAGQNSGGSPPDFVYRLSATYTNNPLTVALIARGISSGTYDNTWVECNSGCPVSTVDNRTTNHNRIDGAIYFDTTLTYTIDWVGESSELYFNVKNISNKDPALVPNGPGGSAYGNPSTNQGLYDFLGRVFRVGIRVNF